MSFNVYIIFTKRLDRYISYVGYAKDINKRLILHNSSKGAKFTKGNHWILLYKKEYLTKSLAMKEEYRLKKDYKLRKNLINRYLIENENCNFTSV